MISLILIIFAAFLNAIMDIIKHHWDQSIFIDLDNDQLYLFFHKTNWQNKYIAGDVANGRKKFLGINIHPAFLDGWHLSKSLMIIALFVAITFYTPIVYPLIDLFIFGFTWNIVFSLFYNKILRT